MSHLRHASQRGRALKSRGAREAHVVAATRHLWAARALGAAVVAVLARFALNPPEGGFPSTLDDWSAPAIFSAAAAVLALATVALAWSRSRHTRTLASLTLALIIAAFMLTLPVDPWVSGIVIAWGLYGFGRMLFDGESGYLFISLTDDPDADDAWLRSSGPAVRHLLLVSVVAGVSTVGYGSDRHLAALMTCQVFAIAALATASWILLSRLRERDWIARLAVILAVAGLATMATPRVSVTLFVFSQIFLLLSMARGTRLTRDLIEGLYERPAALLTTSFIALILTGTLLLAFPAASTSGRSIGFIDALFTATSASCVTGLIVLDTASDFTHFGQAVILLLIQVGGLNIMVLSTFAALLLGRGLGLRGERALGDILDIETPGAARRLIAFIIMVTLSIEGLGAIGMSIAYSRNGFGLLRALWYGGFHSISAFCNAGFALQADSLVVFQHQPLALLLMASLIVLGGLGFAVIGALWQQFRHRGLGHMAAQSRIVIAASLVLIVAGTVAFLMGEWSTSLGGFGLTDKLMNALFQSVTLRTAGFNTVSLGEMRSVTVLWMLAFMFIGASPGSTGGGIKTTTAVVLFAAIPAFLRRRHRVVIGGRSISASVVHQSTSIAVAAVVVVMSGAILLMASQSLTFQELLFEAFSAFGTVGLSLGVTPQLDQFGKVVVVLLMLIGRVGPLAITLLLARDRPSRVRYPEARLMVG